MDEGRKKLTNQLLRYSTIGLEMGFSVAIGVFLGYYLDRYFDTRPWLMMIFMFLGVAAAFRSLFRLMKAVGKKDEGPKE